MNETERVREAGLIALSIAEDWVIDQLEGTRAFASNMQRLRELREILESSNEKEHGTTTAP